MQLSMLNMTFLQNLVMHQLTLRHVNFTLTSGTLTDKEIPDTSRDYNLKEC